MDYYYVIQNSKLSNQVLLQSYCDAVQANCEPDFIQILTDTIQARGLEIPALPNLNNSQAE